jgi:hypothetical protein
MVDDNNKAQKSAAKPEDIHKGDFSVSDKQHILKEAKILFKKLEQGNISPYANPQYMAGAIHEKIYEIGKDASSLVGKDGNKKANKEVGKRIKDAAERSDMRVNPLVDGQFRIPYVDVAEMAFPPLLHAKKVAHGFSPEELLSIKREVKEIKEGEDNSLLGLYRRGLIGTVHAVDRFGIESIKGVFPPYVGGIILEEACKKEMIAPRRECKEIKDDGKGR